MSKYEPGEVPTMVASGLVVPEHELPPRMPKGREAEAVTTSDEMLSCGSMASRRAGGAAWLDRSRECPMCATSQT